MENLWPQSTACDNNTGTHLSGRGGIRKLLHYYRIVSFVNNAYFWHLSSSLKKKNTSYLNGVFLLFKPRYKERSLSPNQSSSARQRRLCWQPEFTHGKSAQCEFCSPTDLEASQQRTKLSQSSCPPWVSSLSSGFIKLLRKGTHQGHLSRKAVGAWPSAHQQLQLRKSALFTVCVSVCEYMCEDRGAGLGGGPGQKAQTGSPGRNTWWELHTMVRSLR